MSAHNAMGRWIRLHKKKLCLRSLSGNAIGTHLILKVKCQVKGHCCARCPGRLAIDWDHSLSRADVILGTTSSTPSFDLEFDLKGQTDVEGHGCVQTWVRLIFLFDSTQSQKFLIGLNSWLTMALQEWIQISSWLKMDFWNLIQIDSRLKKLPECFNSYQLMTHNAFQNFGLNQLMTLNTIWNIDSN